MSEVEITKVSEVPAAVPSRLNRGRWGLVYKAIREAIAGDILRIEVGDNEGAKSLVNCLSSSVSRSRLDARVLKRGTTVYVKKGRVPGPENDDVPF